MTWAAPGEGQDAQTYGLEIAVETDRRDRGFGDSEVQVIMELTNAHGQRSVRQLKILTYEVASRDAGDKSLVIFDRPRDVKGTVLLTHSKILDPDDQWIFLPAIKRVKRISSVNKSGSFVGSEFSYEDMASWEVDKYTYRWLRDEPCGDFTCAVVEARPRYENSGYKKLELFIDLTEYRQQRIKYYDRRGSLMKTLSFHKYGKYLGQYWRAHDLRMINHKTKKATRLIWNRYEFRKGLDENDFHRSALQRIK
tara:strand:+ start:385 stop:1140 length:756 start_codon:yes stop_codon:yes gene_type:complete